MTSKMPNRKSFKRGLERRKGKLAKPNSSDEFRFEAMDELLKIGFKAGFDAEGAIMFAASMSKMIENAMLNDFEQKDDDNP